MQIVRLQAENFKRLKAVSIEPDGSVVVIGGKNGQGKSSVLDAIFVALKGRAVAPPQPVRKGEEVCTIALDLGDLKVTRKFRQKDGLEYTDSVKVENAEGLRYGKPQQVLDELLGEIGFDPFDFTRLKPADQVGRLLEMVPLSVDLDELREDDLEDYDARRDANRDVKRLEAELEGVPAEELPTDPPDRDEIVKALSSAAETNTAIGAEEQRRESEAKRIAGLRAAADTKAERIKLLEAEISDLEGEIESITEDADRSEQTLNGLEPVAEPVDTDDLTARLAEADKVAAVVARQERRAGIVERLNAAQAKSKALTEAMAGRQKQRNDAIAEADMPVEGLGIDYDEKGAPYLTYQGLPFDPDQISSAAQLRVSTAIGMAANPELRVMRVMDGSLLDEDSMTLLAEMAEAEDFQLWVEVVGDNAVGVIMESGEVRGAEAPEPLEKPKKAPKKKKAEPDAEAEDAAIAAAADGGDESDLFGGDQ